MDLSPSPTIRPAWLRRDRLIEYGMVAAFIAVMAVANLAIAYFGPWAIPVVSFITVGLVLVIRDYLHDTWAMRPGSFWLRMLAMIVAAGVLAYVVDASAGMIAVASVAALMGSSIVETLAFQGVFRRRWMIRSNVSNVAGAVADSLIFPIVAFGVAGVGGWGPLAALVATQAATKTFGGFLWTSLFRFTLDPDTRRERRARLAGVAA